MLLIISSKINAIPNYIYLNWLNLYFKDSSDGDDSDKDKLYSPGCSKIIQNKFDLSKKLIFKT